VTSIIKRKPLIDRYELAPFARLTAYKPVQYTFSRGRQPAVRRWLEPASFYAGTGIGFSSVEIDGTSNAVSGDDDSIAFAWNAGFGVNYAFTDHVCLRSGYRYVSVGERTIDLIGVFPDPTTNSISTFRFTSFASPCEFASSSSSAPGVERGDRPDPIRFLATPRRLG
jgi:hypothetical protein